LSTTEHEPSDGCVRGSRPVASDPAPQADLLPARPTRVPASHKVGQKDAALRVWLPATRAAISRPRGRLSARGWDPEKGVIVDLTPEEVGPLVNGRIDLPIGQGADVLPRLQPLATEYRVESIGRYDHDIGPPDRGLRIVNRLHLDAGSGLHLSRK